MWVVLVGTNKFFLIEELNDNIIEIINKLNGYIIENYSFVSKKKIDPGLKMYIKLKNLNIDIKYTFDFTYKVIINDSMLPYAINHKLITLEEYNIIRESLLETYKKDEITSVYKQVCFYNENNYLNFKKIFET